MLEPPSYPPPSDPPPGSSSREYLSCADVLSTNGFSSTGLPTVESGGNVYDIRDTISLSVTKTRCAFEGQGPSAIAWTLSVTKAGAWEGDGWSTSAALSWKNGLARSLPGLGSIEPRTDAPYKHPRVLLSEQEEAVLGGQGQAMFTYFNDYRRRRRGLSTAEQLDVAVTSSAKANVSSGSDADGSSAGIYSAQLRRVGRALDRDYTWEFYEDELRASARRRLDPEFASGVGSAPRYLVFSHDGGMCFTYDAGDDAMGFDCSDSSGVQDLLGLVDASTASSFANCETYGFKNNEADTTPREYLSDTCEKAGSQHGTDARCSEGGQCKDSQCCVNMMRPYQEKCGTQRCQPYCVIKRAQVDACGDDVEWLLTGGYVNLWLGASVGG